MKFSGMQLEGNADNQSGLPIGEETVNCNFCGRPLSDETTNAHAECSAEQAEHDREVNVFDVTLSRHPFSGWQVGVDDGDFDGDHWRAPYHSYGSTMEIAIKEYEAYLDGEGEINFILQIEGPTVSIENYNSWVKKDPTMKGRIIY